MATLDEKIEEFFNKVEQLLESHGFQYIGDEDYKYCNDFVGYVEISFEKNGKYVDISLKLLLDNECKIVGIKQLIIDDDNDILDDDLYDKINSLYRSFFVD